MGSSDPNPFTQFTEFCVVGSGTQIYPGVQLRSGIYPAGHVVKLRQQIQIVEAR